MPSAAFEEILEEAEDAKVLPPEEQQRIHGLLKDEKLAGAMWFLLAVGLVYLIEKTKRPQPDVRRRLDHLLNLVAVESGVVSRADFVRGLRGKYAHLKLSSEEFAAQKQEEIELENRHDLRP